MQQGLIWVCLKIGYIPNYSHLIGIMISKTIGFRGTLFSDTPIWRCANIVGTGKTLSMWPKKRSHVAIFCCVFYRESWFALLLSAHCRDHELRCDDAWTCRFSCCSSLQEIQALPLWFLMPHPLPLPDVWWLDTTGDVNWPQNDAMSSSPSAPGLPSSRSFASAAKHWASPMCRCGVHCAVCHYIVLHGPESQRRHRSSAIWTQFCQRFSAVDCCFHVDGPGKLSLSHAERWNGKVLKGQNQLPSSEQHPTRPGSEEETATLHHLLQMALAASHQQKHQH